MLDTNYSVLCCADVFRDGGLHSRLALCTVRSAKFRCTVHSVQCSAVQCSAVQCSAQCAGTEEKAVNSRHQMGDRGSRGGMEFTKESV